MFANEINFQLTKNSNISIHDVEDKVTSFIYELKKGGNLCAGHVLFTSENNIKVSCYLSAPNALDEKYLTSWAKNKFLDLKNCGLVIHWDIQDEKSEKDTNKELENLYLMPSFGEDESPICNGRNGKPIPLFTLQLSEGLKQQIYFWTNTYKYIDRIFINSGPLEIPTYKEMAYYNSHLSQEGRQLCADIESSTRITSYYFVKRYWGRKSNEESRLCPKCGKNWFKGRETKNGIGQFDFQCKPCRLVSYLGIDISDERHARIGEWNKKSLDI